MKFLVSREECDLKITENKGNTPLHTACKHGHHSAVEFLVADQRCQLNLKNRKGETPLHIASEHGHLDDVEVLVSRKDCDLNIIESVDSICRDSADTQCMLIQTNFSKSPKQLTYRPL